MQRLKINDKRWCYLVLVLMTVLSQIIYTPALSVDAATASTGQEVTVAGLSGQDAVDEAGTPITDATDWTTYDQKTIRYNWSINDDVAVKSGDYATFTLPAGTVLEDNITDKVITSAAVDGTGSVAVGYVNGVKGGTSGTITFNDYFKEHPISRSGTLEFLVSGTKQGLQANGLLLKNGWGISPNSQGFSTQMYWQLSLGPDPDEKTHTIISSLNNVVLVDNIEANNQTLDSPITVKYTTGSHQEGPTLGKDYTLTMDTANSFTLKWIGPLSDKVDVNYTTKINDANYLATGQAAYFKNNATLTGQKDVTAENPNGEPIDPESHHDNTELHFTRKLGGVSGSATGDDVVTVPFNKVWHDGENQDGIRPSAISVQLYKNGVAVNAERQTIRASDGWQGTFSDLPKNENGQPINYTVGEVAVPADYQSSVVGTTITNTHIPAVTSIKGHKVWDDQDNQDGIRPESITVDLYAHTANDPTERNVDKRQVLTSGDGSYEFDNLPEKSAGQKIIYQVKEASIPEGYSSQVSSDNTLITNTHTPSQTSLVVRKIWQDDNNQDGLRPTNVLIQLMADGRATGTSIELNQANKWQANFERLAKYQAGKEVTYSVVETTQTAGYQQPSYTKTSNGYDVTNRHESAQTTVKGRKIWNDQNDQDGLRLKQAEITINLYAHTESDPTEQFVDSKKVSTSGDGSYEFNNLPENSAGEKLIYTVKETDVPTGYTSSVVGTTITNTHVPEVTSIKGQKIWQDNDDQDGLRPAKITVNLLADGKVIDSREVTKDHEQYEFSNLPVKSSGENIVYKVAEATIPAGYTSVVSADNSTITNSHTPATTSIKGQKIWHDGHDQDGLRLKQKTITVNLYAHTDSNPTEQFVNSKKVSTSGDGSYEFNNLPENSAGEKLIYTVKETDVPTGYTSSVVGTTITNTHVPEVTAIKGQKIWQDNHNQDGLRPDNVVLNLVVNGETTNKSVTLNNESNWQYRFGNLAKYQNGVLVKYSVVELTETNGYDPKYSETETGWDVTNSHTPATTSITGQKIWQDNHNQDGLRPDKITVNLLADGKVIDRQEVTNDHEQYEFSNLPVLAAGKKIQYTVAEASIPNGYTSVVSPDGTTITNTHQPLTRTITGQKVWQDNNNQAGTRPKSITINLLANGQFLKRLTITAQQNWQYSFTDLPVNQAGQAIDYQITENQVPGYHSQVNGFEIVNTLLPTTPVTPEQPQATTPTTKPTVKPTVKTIEPQRHSATKSVKQPTKAIKHLPQLNEQTDYVGMILGILLIVLGSCTLLRRVEWD
ncbi:Cna B-type domain-containing protein [Lapidilactobacillus wuchangensis]|uniref:Cna B-type domain-containing protein n=1 Tax=Lapidilactobacillus wuchangensis TaxID=2486001 RepID=UPI000F79F7B3|nr:Cna B-type domain-containing protein [Lapidilactobacillus wuchangensis]